MTLPPVPVLPCVSIPACRPVLVMPEESVPLPHFHSLVVIFSAPSSRAAHIQWLKFGSSPMFSGHFFWRCASMACIIFAFALSSPKDR